MKRLLFIALLVVFGCAKPINDETLIDKDGVKYHPDTNELYSGKVFKNRMGGKKKFEGSYKDGKETDYGFGGMRMDRRMTVRTYKDEELISQNCWDKNGIEKECE